MTHVGGGAIESAADASAVAAQIAERVAAMAGDPKVRAVHLFYIGPAVIIALAASRFQVLSVPVVIHERLPVGDTYEYFPMLRFAGGSAKLVGSD